MARLFRVSSRSMSFAPQFLRKGAAKPATVADITFSAGRPVPPPKNPVPVRDRKYLPANRNDNFPVHLSAARPDFPPTLEADVKNGEADMATWARAFKPALDEALNSRGCVLVRGIPFQSDPKRFSNFMKTIKLEFQCDKFMAGRSMTSSDVADQVRTGSDDDARYTIEPHHEYNVASANRPRKLFLMCAEEPVQGGEWSLTDSRGVLRDMDKNVIDKLEKKGVRYEVFYPSKATPNFYNCWEDNIAPTREAAEEYLTGAGCQWTWNDSDNSLLIHRVLPAIVPHYRTSERVWFNQIHAHHNTFYNGCHPDFEGKWGQDKFIWPVNTLYGDGTPIEDSTLAHIRELVWKHTVAVPLELGSMLCVDNYVVMHGRMGFPKGTPRQTLVSIIYE